MPYDVKQVIVIRKDLNMRTGKLCAQVAHASMKFLIDKMNQTEEDDCSVFRFLSDEETTWCRTKFAKIVCYVNSEQELLELVERGRLAGLSVNPIVDSGYTEFNGVATLTCAAFGPDKKEKLDEVTGHLKLM